ncbi:hypothetical protein D3C76_1732830 [compost metagenome]
MGHVGQPHGGLDHLIETDAAFGQGFADAFQSGPGLNLNVATHHFAVGAHGDLPGKEQKAADLHRLGKRIRQVAGDTLDS